MVRLPLCNRLFLLAKKPGHKLPGRQLVKTVKAFPESKSLDSMKSAEITLILTGECESNEFRGRGKKSHVGNFIIFGA